MRIENFHTARERIFFDAFCSYGMTKEDAFTWMELVRKGTAASRMEDAKPLDKGLCETYSYAY